MICAHFGWTWEYLHNGIPFNTIQKIMQDLPVYETDDNTDEDTTENGPSEIREQTAEEFAAAMNNFSL